MSMTCNRTNIFSTRNKSVALLKHISLMDILSIMGSVASIAGGIFSWWQYKKAKTAAQEAQNAKDSVLNRQQIGEIEKVIMSAHEAERILIERTSRTTTNRGK